ncbi:hypothetical protein TSOC_003854 [Tetrabaena socialis]|uniref:RAP domain-containing protein n=1 Tax=Tetrabaena socialis TaxID=47790 RepID=A0A2J8AAH8_9CHLO|nr:hypothetical protein TSOC_003854 [Tetrabaena socialis]|eukprot:PNH09529.1 hypothetical protein TSOC_003854 [Tetrabaena socialis]
MLRQTPALRRLGVTSTSPLRQLRPSRHTSTVTSSGRGSSGRGSSGGRGDGDSGGRGGYGAGRGAGRGSDSRGPSIGTGLQWHDWPGGRAGGGAGGAGGGDPGKARDLPSLAAMVEAGAADWAAAQNVSRLCAAFNTASKLGASPSQLPLLHRTLAILAAAYLSLAPQLATAKSCTMPLWACAKAGYWGGGLASALLQRLGRGGGALLQETTDQGHANVWLSLSVAPAGVLEALGRTDELLHFSADSLLRMRVEEIGPQACSNVLLACSRLRYSRGDLLHHLTACLAAQPAANHQDFANGLYSLGELCEDCGHTPQPQDLHRLTTGVVGLLQAPQNGRYSGGFISQHLSNMLLGCSKLGYADPALLRPLADMAGQAAGRMNEQELANSLYALGVLGCKAPAYTPAVQCLVAEVQQRLQRQPGRFKPQELSTILYALALLQPECGHQWSAVVELLAAEYKRRGFAGFNAQDLSNSAWALEKLGYRSDQGWFTAAVAAAARPDIMRTFTAQGLSNLWLALGRARHHPVAALLEGTIEASEVLRTQATGQGCANMLLSLATLGDMYNRRLVDVLVKRLWELLPKRGEVNEQDMANSLWALAVMSPDALVRYRRVVERLLRKLVRRWSAAEAAAIGDSGVPFASAALVQLWQVQQELAHADECGELAGILAAAEGAAGYQNGSLFRAMQCAAAAEGGIADGAMSDLQRQVVSALGRLQRRQQLPAGVSSIASVSGEQVVEGLVGRVDVVVELAGGRWVAVEVDGPWHFLANDPHTRDRNGPTQLRDRQLGRLFGAGNVVSVPYWEWCELRNDRGREEEYLAMRVLGLGAGGR